MSKNFLPLYPPLRRALHRARFDAELIALADIAADAIVSLEDGTDRESAFLSETAVRMPLSFERAAKSAPALSKPPRRLKSGVKSGETTDDIRDVLKLVEDWEQACADHGRRFGDMAGMVEQLLSAIDWNDVKPRAIAEALGFILEHSSWTVRARVARVVRNERQTLENYAKPAPARQAA